MDHARPAVAPLKVVLINPPYLSNTAKPELFLPLGLGYIAGAAGKHGYTVSIIDAQGSGAVTRLEAHKYWIGDTLDEIRRQITEFKPDAVGIGCFFSTRFPVVLELARLVKTIDKRIPTIVGGIHTSLFPEQVLTHEEIDYVIIGEGEESFVRLLDSIAAGARDFTAIDGCAYRDQGNVVVQPKTRYIQDLDSLPPPARELFNVDTYLRNRKTRWGMTVRRQMSMITSRSCPGKCTFCSTHAVHGPAWRPRSPDNVVDEIEHLIKTYGIEGISFEDDNIALDKRRMIAICEKIIARTWISGGTPLMASGSIISTRKY